MYFPLSLYISRKLSKYTMLCKHILWTKTVINSNTRTKLLLSCVIIDDESVRVIWLAILIRFTDENIHIFVFSLSWNTCSYNDFWNSKIHKWSHVFFSKYKKTRRNRNDNSFNNSTFSVTTPSELIVWYRSIGI